MKIRTKIIANVVVTVIAVGLVVSIAAATLARNGLQAEAESKGEALAQALAYNARYGLAIEDSVILSDLIHGVLVSGDITFALFADSNGRVIAKEVTSDDHFDEQASVRDITSIASLDRFLFGSTLITRVPVMGQLADPMLSLDDYGSAQSAIGYVVIGLSMEGMASRVRAIFMGAGFTLLLGLLIFGGAAAFLARRSLAPLMEIQRATERITQGDFTARVEVVGTDELGVVGQQFNTMAASLSDMVAAVHRTSDSVAAEAERITLSTREVLQGSKVQAQASEETSSSMEEIAVQIITVAGNAERLSSNVNDTSSSIEEMGASIEQISRNADLLASSVEVASSTVEEMLSSINEVASNVERAEEMSSLAAEEAATSGNSVLRTVERMRKIGETMESTSGVIQSLGQRGTEIEKIIVVIEDIADQTNLLALNAAIEAARAGDAGRGFAVVADEVRKLAERSVAATKEISRVIGEVVTETEKAVLAVRGGVDETQQGIKIADEAVSAIERIRESVDSTSSIMREILISTQAQRDASTHVTSAMLDMNRITSEVQAATAEQAKGSASIVKAVEEMRKQTEEVSMATDEQKRGGEMVVAAIENISAIARDNLRAMEDMNTISSGLAEQSEELRKSLAQMHFSE